MGRMRKPFQGVGNIVRFNWHFYLLSLLVLLLILAGIFLMSALYTPYLWFLFFGILATSLISLFVSYYVYDCAGLYEMEWLPALKIDGQTKLLNINAGFDETSILLKEKFAKASMTVMDFYNPAKHTEVSIKRARKAYPPYPETQAIKSSNIPIEDASIDYVFLFLSAHEIRIASERTLFFQELARVLKPEGKIIVVEHLRDLPNFLAYNIGFFHFHSRASWQKNFQEAGLQEEQVLKITQFITSFILSKHGITS